MEKENFASLSVTEISQRWYILFFVFKSLEFLNNSTVSKIPFELVAVLDEALNDWTSTDEYIIVTSLVNNMNGFSFDNSLMFNDFIYTDIELLYKVTFDKKLVQINIPVSTYRDYLANVVLYHELGHFIDRKYEITRVFYIQLLEDLQKGTIKSSQLIELCQFFPYLSEATNVDWFRKNYSPFNLLSAHIAEYFCDLFASQYINDCSNHYLEYITLNQADYSPSHPSTINRVVLVKKFIDATPSLIVDRMQETVFGITGKKLEKRFSLIKSDNFQSLVPYDVKDSKELHGLFKYGWSVWLGDWKDIESKAEIKFPLTQVKVYEIINNLIEKSVGNYVVQKEWSSVA